MLMLLIVSAFLVLLVAENARRSRKRFLRSGDVFRCRLRVRGYPSAIWPSLVRHWSRPMWAMWDQEVLVVRRSPARIIALRTLTPVDGVRSLPPRTPRWCGPQPVGVVMQIWDGSWIEIAAAAEDRMAVVGPYVAAAVSDLPQAPVPRRPS